MNPWILFHDLCALGTMSAQYSASGYPPSSVSDWRAEGPYRWKSSEVADHQWLRVSLDPLDAGKLINLGDPISCCIGGHNLQTIRKSIYEKELLVMLKASNDGGATWGHFPFVHLSEQDDPTWPNAPIVVVACEPCPVQSPTLFHLSIDAFGDPYPVPPEIGILTLGPALVFPRGPQPGWDIDGETPLTDWNVNRGGSPLGANFKGVEKNFTINYPEPGFTDDELWGGSGLASWPNFVAHARRFPFWFSPDGDAIWLSHLNGQFQNPRLAYARRRTLSMPVSRFRV